MFALGASNVATARSIACLAAFLSFTAVIFPSAQTHTLTHTLTSRGNKLYASESGEVIYIFGFKRLEKRNRLLDYCVSRRRAM